MSAGVCRCFRAQSVLIQNPMPQAVSERRDWAFWVFCSSLFTSYFLLFFVSCECLWDEQVDMCVCVCVCCAFVSLCDRALVYYVCKYVTVPVFRLNQYWSWGACRAALKFLSTLQGSRSHTEPAASTQHNWGSSSLSSSHQKYWLLMESNRIRSEFFFFFFLILPFLQTWINMTLVLCIIHPVLKITL